MLAEEEASPARPPWTSDNAFVRSRFIVKRLKRMRSKTRSLAGDLEGSFFYQSQEPSSLPYDVNSCISSDSLASPMKEGELFKCCSPEKHFESIIERVSSRNKECLREEEVVFCEEAVESIRSESSPGTLSRAEEKEEHEKGFIDKHSELNVSKESIYSALEVESQDVLQEDEGCDLLECIEESLPEHYSLKRRLNCMHSVIMYRTLLRLNRPPRQRKRCKNTLPSDSHCSEENSIDKELKRLEVELMVQRMLLAKARKEVILSNLSRQLHQEQLEAEKELLLTGIKCDAVEKEIDRLRSLQKSKNSLEEESGYASIREITVTVEKLSAWSSYDIILVAVERETVRGSEFEHVSSDCQLKFTAPLYFHKLRPDFTVYLYLYGIMHKDHKHKLFHRSNERLHYLPKALKMQKRRSLVIPEYGHNFVLMGSAKVQLSHIQNNQLILQTNTQSFGQTLRVRVQGDVYLDALHTGFLDVRQVGLPESDARTVWMRFWFRLSGLDLQGWSYPSLQSIEPPQYHISLKNCPSKTIEPVYPSFCVRPHSFALEMNQNGVQLLCAADSADEMFFWCQKLNKAIKAARAWNFK